MCTYVCISCLVTIIQTMLRDWMTSSVKLLYPCLFVYFIELSRMVYYYKVLKICVSVYFYTNTWILICRCFITDSGCDTYSVSQSQSINFTQAMRARPSNAPQQSSVPGVVPPPLGKIIFDITIFMIFVGLIEP